MRRWAWIVTFLREGRERDQGGLGPSFHRFGSFLRVRVAGGQAVMSERAGRHAARLPGSQGQRESAETGPPRGAGGETPRFCGRQPINVLLRFGWFSNGPCGTTGCGVRAVTRFPYRLSLAEAATRGSRSLLWISVHVDWRELFICK